MFSLSIELFNRNQIYSPFITQGPANTDKFKFHHKHNYVNVCDWKKLFLHIKLTLRTVHLVYSTTLFKVDYVSHVAVTTETCSIQEHRELQTFGIFPSEREMYDFTAITYRRSYLGGGR